MAMSRSLSSGTAAPARARSVIPPVRRFANTPAAPRIAEDPALEAEADVLGEMAAPHEVAHVRQQQRGRVPVTAQA